MDKMTEPNVRFWVYANDGPVKLTLKPGQRLEHFTNESTDEGWHSESTTWHYPDDEAAVYREWCSDGRDCDGRLTTGGEVRCHLAQRLSSYPTKGGLVFQLRRQLASGNNPYTEGDNPETWRGVIWPAWQESRNDGVYDEFAQAAGY